MKKEHEKILENMLNDIRQIPPYVSGMGASSATLQSRLQAAKDYQEVHVHEVMIFDGIFMSEKYQKILKRSDIEKEEIQDMIEKYESDIKKHSRELHEFIEERKRKMWD